MHEGATRGNNRKHEDFIMAKVAYLGLGVMGYPMAGHLAAKGHDVTVYNRTTSKAEARVKSMSSA